MMVMSDVLTEAEDMAAVQLAAGMNMGDDDDDDDVIGGIGLGLGEKVNMDWMNNDAAVLLLLKLTLS